MGTGLGFWVTHKSICSAESSTTQTSSDTFQLYARSQSAEQHVAGVFSLVNSVLMVSLRAYKVFLLKDKAVNGLWLCGDRCWGSVSDETFFMEDFVHHGGLLANPEILQPLDKPK